MKSLLHTALSAIADPGAEVMHPLIEEHRQEIIEIAERNGFTNLRVFGSMARGDATDESDVDLLVSVDDSRHHEWARH